MTIEGASAAAGHDKNGNLLGFATTDEIGSVMDMTKRRKTKTAGGNRKSGEDAGADEDVGGDEDEDEDEVVGTGAAAAPTLEWAAGCAAWYVGRARATLPAPSEAARPQGGEGGHGMDDAAGGDAAARQGDGTAGGGGAGRMGAVGMEVEGPTDGAAEVGQGAAGMAAADSTDTTGGGGGPTKARKKTKRGKKGGRSQYERQRGARKR